jgi:branched-chain amino acid transport system permease protein
MARHHESSTASQKIFLHCHFPQRAFVPPALAQDLDPQLGGGTGISLRGLNIYPREMRLTLTYWLTLAFAILMLLLLFLLLRHRAGVALQAIRDDEEAAASLGVRVRQLKAVLYVLAGFGCGAAGALLVANICLSSRIRPSA